MITLYAKQKETQMYRTDFWTLWEKARVGCSEGIALKQVYYQGWNRSPAQVACMRQVFRAAALGRPRGMAWGTHVNPWLIHVNVWQKPLQYCKVISLQLIKINEKKKASNIHTLLDGLKGSLSHGLLQCEPCGSLQHHAFPGLNHP